MSDSTGLLAELQRQHGFRHGIRALWRVDIGHKIRKRSTDCFEAASDVVNCAA